MDYSDREKLRQMWEDYGMVDFMREVRDMAGKQQKQKGTGDTALQSSHKKITSPHAEKAEKAAKQQTAILLDEWKGKLMRFHIGFIGTVLGTYFDGSDDDFKKLNRYRHRCSTSSCDWDYHTLATDVTLDELVIAVRSFLLTLWVIMSFFCRCVTCLNYPTLRVYGQ